MILFLREVKRRRYSVEKMGAKDALVKPVVQRQHGPAPGQ